MEGKGPYESNVAAPGSPDALRVVSFCARALQQDLRSGFRREDLLPRLSMEWRCRNLAFLTNMGIPKAHPLNVLLSEIPSLGRIPANGTDVGRYPKSGPGSLVRTHKNVLARMLKRYPSL
jgi:hypothetical protein